MSDDLKCECGHYASEHTFWNGCTNASCKCEKDQTILYKNSYLLNRAEIDGLGSELLKLQQECLMLKDAIINLNVFLKTENLEWSPNGKFREQFPDLTIRIYKTYGYDENGKPIKEAT